MHYACQQVASQNSDFEKAPKTLNHFGSSAEVPFSTPYVRGVISDGSGCSLGVKIKWLLSQSQHERVSKPLVQKEHTPKPHPSPRTYTMNTKTLPPQAPCIITVTPRIMIPRTAAKPLLWLRDDDAGTTPATTTTTSTFSFCR